LRGGGIALRSQGQRAEVVYTMEAENVDSNY
jgi:hypothetical protein